MTEPPAETGGDATELSARNKESEDVTQLSARVRGQLDDDSDEYTQLSARHLAAEENTADATRLSRRSAAAGATAPVRPKPKISALPPGAIGGAIAERGSFGTPPEEYMPRPLPTVVPAPAERATPVAQEVGVLDPVETRHRRESARHRRLIVTAIVVGLVAAVTTAAIIWIVALASG